MKKVHNLYPKTIDEVTDEYNALYESSERKFLIVSNGECSDIYKFGNDMTPTGLKVETFWLNSLAEKFCEACN